MHIDLNTQFKRALQGDAEQLYALGMRYYLGDDVVQDYKSALALFTQSASRNFTQAQFHLALMYYEGHGVKRNFKQAGFWFGRAAQSGYIWAHYYLSLMKENNRLTENNRLIQLPDRRLTRSIRAFEAFANISQERFM